eukprot:scaffold912_cov187-Ochromonas_danica.AAC.10
MKLRRMTLDAWQLLSGGEVFVFPPMKVIAMHQESFAQQVYKKSLSGGDSGQGSAMILRYCVNKANSN